MSVASPLAASSGAASGRGFDARKTLPYPPYDRLAFTVPVRQDGDVNARVWLRLLEIEQSLGLIEQILAGLPGGPGIGAGRAWRPARAWAWSRAFAATCWSGWSSPPMARIRRCHPRDPSWFQWPLLETAVEGNIVADFPLCNKSFNCSYAGCDL